MKRSLFVGAGLLAATIVADRPAGHQRRSGHPGLPEDQRRVGERQQHRLRLDEQPDDALGRDVPQVLPEREGAGRRQGVVHRSAGAHRRHRAVRTDVPHDALDRDRPVPAAYGYKPTEIRTSYDALSVYVHRTTRSSSCRWRRSRRSSARAAAAASSRTSPTWGQLGLTGDWANRPIGSVRPQLRQRHLRVLQGACPEERRLQGYGQGAAGLGVRRPGHHRGSLRDRLQRQRLPDVGRPRRSSR